MAGALTNGSAEITRSFLERAGLTDVVEYRDQRGCLGPDLTFGHLREVLPGLPGDGQERR